MIDFSLKDLTNGSPNTSILLVNVIWLTKEQYLNLMNTEATKIQPGYILLVHLGITFKGSADEDFIIRHYYCSANHIL